MAQSVVCKVGNQGVRFSRSLLIGWEATNLPPGSFRFSDRETFYWELEMLKFTGSVLHLRVTNYTANPKAYQSDRAARSTINKIVFAPLEKSEWLPQLAYYRLADLAPRLSEEGNDETGVTAPDFSQYLEDGQSTPKLPAPSVREREVRFRTAFTDLRIGNGCVAGETSLPGLEGILEFTIPNHYLVAELDAVKAYFVRRFKRKTIEVRALLTTGADGEPTLVRARSEQVAAIDDRMLEVLRTRSLQQLANFSLTRSVDKSLFTPDELFGSLDEDHLGKASATDDGLALLDALLRNLTVRNTRQLAYLAGRLHGDGRKLRYVLSPKFGFVFLVVGEQAHHFILELLNDHATYVWSIPNEDGNKAEKFSRIEKQLSIISAVGRNAYRRLAQFDVPFWVVVHEHAASGVTDGFPRWRNRLLEGLV